jgi:hypothetical protein
VNAAALEILDWSAASNVCHACAILLSVGGDELFPKEPRGNTDAVALNQAGSSDRHYVATIVRHAFITSRQISKQSLQQHPKCL